MQRKGNGSFAFFITPPDKQPEQPVITPMFNFDEQGGLPYLPTITLFGTMTLDECKMLAALVYLYWGVRMRVPQDFDHARFHGDTVTMSCRDFFEHLYDFFGHPEQLPKRAVLSMGAFFDYLRDKAVLSPVKTPKNPSSRY